MNLSEAIQTADAGLKEWAARPWNARWWRRIDGTPIPNDLTVTIAEAFYRALNPAKNSDSSPSEASASAQATDEPNTSSTSPTGTK